jgi:hypothetical protein
MFKLAAAGLAIFLAGAIKFALHLGRSPTLEDYLALRCGGPEASESLLFPHGLFSLAHCWGCYAMAAGAALLALAAVSQFTSAQKRAGGRR